MARYRLSRLAQADLAQILTTSLERWGSDAERRYAMVIEAAMRKVAAEPEGRATKPRGGRHMAFAASIYGPADCPRGSHASLTANPTITLANSQR